jgi:hypothetical protein
LITAGLQCLTCHSNGLNLKDNALVPSADAYKGFNAKAISIMNALYATPSNESSVGELALLIRRDNEFLAGKVNAAGTAPSGEDLFSALNAVASAYDQQLDIEAVAAELGTDSATLRAALQKSSSNAALSAILQSFSDKSSPKIKRSNLTRSFKDLIKAVYP